MAEELKTLGNQCLQKQQYDDAIKYYTQAIDIDATNPVFFSNRAQVHIKVENYGLAIQDCDQALALNPDFVKAYYRRGVALMAILKYKEAQQNFKKILTKLPNDKLTLENYKQCNLYLKRLAFERAIASDDKTLLVSSVDFDSISIEKFWTGPDLQITRLDGKVDISGLDLEYLKYMIKTFKEGGRLPKRHVFGIVAKAWELFSAEPALVELVTPSKADLKVNLAVKKFTIVGDTHGQFYDVLNLFDSYGFVDEDHAFLFNGDFVDRGSWSCEVALYLYVLKCIYPNRVFINRGNHETNDMNKTYGFADECEYKYSKKVFEAFSESFGALPYASLINNSYLVMHGGLFSDDSITIDDIRSIKRTSTQPPKEGIAMELLWTDPQPENGRNPSKRGIGLQFGPDITERFCVKNKIRKVLRSHEVRMSGVEEEHDGRLITVFSAPNYCDSTGNLGGIVNVVENAKYDPAKDKGKGYLKPDENSPWALEIERFKEVAHPDIKPMAYSKSGFGF